MESGIYKITCLPTGKIYVGSAICLKYRINRHFNDLLKGGHSSKHLQNAYNLYGKDSFQVDYLETYERSKIDRIALLEREQFYLDTLKPYDREIGFNSCKIAGSPNVSMTQETRDKIRKSLAGRKRPPEVVERIKKGLTGRKMPDSFCDKQRLLKTGLKQSEENIAQRARDYSFKGPDGTIYQGSNLKRFCEEHNLSRPNMKKLLTGERKTHHGFTKY